MLQMNILSKHASGIALNFSWDTFIFNMSEVLLYRLMIHVVYPNTDKKNYSSYFATWRTSTEWDAEPTEREAAGVPGMEPDGVIEVID